MALLTCTVLEEVNIDGKARLHCIYGAFVNAATRGRASVNDRRAYRSSFLVPIWKIRQLYR